MGLLASRLFRLTSASSDPRPPAPRPLFQPAFQPCRTADNAALDAVAAPQVKEIDPANLSAELTPEELRAFESAAPADFKHVFEGARHAEYRAWLTRLFGGPILVRLDRNQVHTPRLKIRYQRMHDCVLPDDREKLVRANPRALNYEILDEATQYLWALWKAENRPNVFEVVA